MLFDAALAQAQMQRHFFRRPALEVPQSEDFALAGGKPAEHLPQHPLSLALRGRVLRTVMDALAIPELIERFGPPPPALPPTGAQPVAAGVDRHRHQPFVPRVRTPARTIE